MTEQELNSIWDCPVYLKNLSHNQDFATQMLNSMGLVVTYEFFKSPESFLGSTDSHDDTVRTLYKSSKLYKDSFTKLADEYKFPVANLEDCRLMMELCADGYLRFSSKIMLKSYLKIIEKDFDKLGEKIDVFLHELKPLENYGDSIDVMLGEPSVTENLEDLKRNLQTLSNLKNRLRESQIGKMGQLGDRSPIGNPGLYLFIDGMHRFWIGLLKRSLKQSYDNKNGRKQFCNFLIATMRPIHPALSSETIDNSLKKYQSDLKKEA